MPWTIRFPTRTSLVVVFFLKQSKLGAAEAGKLIVFDVTSLNNASNILKSIARTTSVNLSESKRR